MVCGTWTRVLGAGVPVSLCLTAGRIRGNMLSHLTLMETGLRAVRRMPGPHQLRLPLCIRGTGRTCRRTEKSKVSVLQFSQNYSLSALILKEAGYPGTAPLCNQVSSHTSVISELILMKLRRVTAGIVDLHCRLEFGELNLLVTLKLSVTLWMRWD